MTTQDTHGSTSSSQRVKPNNVSSISQPLFNVSMSWQSRSLEVTMAPSSRTTHWMDFLVKRGYNINMPHLTLPQHNGVVERKNQTLIEAARTMLAEFNTPIFLWAEAIATACHATNHLYLRKGLNKTPYEVLTDNKPNVQYFRVFGCKCFVLKKGIRLSKFDTKAHEGRFVGYATDSHAFRIYVPSQRREIGRASCRERMCLYV